MTPVQGNLPAPKLTGDEYVQQLEKDLKTLRIRLKSEKGKCQILTVGDECTCGLCERDNEIYRLNRQLEASSLNARNLADRLREAHEQVRELGDEVRQSWEVM